MARVSTTAPAPSREGPSREAPAPEALVPARLGLVRTVAVPGDAARDLIAHLPGTGDPLAWVRRGQGLVGWGEVARVEVTGATRFTDAHTAWQHLLRTAVVQDEVREPGTGPVAFASLAFADDSPAGGVLVVPEVVLGHRDDRWWVTTVSTAADGGGSSGGAALPVSSGPPPSPGAVVFADGALPGPRYVAAVAAAVARIRGGDLEKVVLARDLQAVAQRPVDVRWLLDRLARAYPSCWSFAVDGLVGATPELLVRRERGLVHSRVLAGTIRRTGSAERDAGLAGSLARSGKDLEEHEYAVRSVVQALAPHCTTTTASEAPFVLHLPNVMHLATDVTGVLAPCAPGQDPSVLHLAAALHPTAAVCGTPTPVAAAVIAELEGVDRDRFAGPVGWVDARGDGEMGLALRCARVDADDPRRVRLFAGAGVVAGSDPASELAETEAKLVPVREALGG